MSDQKPALGGLFVNKKASAAPASAVPGGGKPKNVRQRWILLGVAGLGFIVLSSSFLSKKPEVAHVESKKDNMVSITPAGVDKQDWMTQSSEKIRSLESTNSQLTGQLASLSQTVSKLQDDKEKADLTAASKARQEAAGGGQNTVMPGNIVPPPVLGAKNAPAAATTAANIPPPPPTPFGQAGGRTSAIPVPTTAPGMDTALPAPMAEPQVFKPEPKTVSATTGNAAGAGAGALEASNAKSKFTKNPYNGFLPAGAFAPVVLLNGLDAGTSTSTQANPMPVLMNITDNATLPGAAKYSLRSCFVMGTGYGDMSAERVYVRYSRLSCVDKQNRLVLSADVSGYLVDSDGKIGLRGKVVDRQGAKLGKALLAGFAQGLAGAFGQAQSTTSTTALGSTSSIGGDAALRAAGLGGAQSAAQQLAQFYLKEAQAMFPVISIDTGRTGTIVFTDNASLAWSSGDGAYVKEIKPVE